MRLYDPAGQRLYLTHEERCRLLEAAQDALPLPRAITEVLAYTGCRISEAVALTVNRIDPDARVLVFESLKKRRDGVFRAVPVPAPLFKTLTPLTGGLSPHRRIFPVHRATAYRYVLELMQNAGIEGAHATPKGLRHGFGVSAVQRGVPLNMVQKWLGHENIKTTAIYANAVGAEEYEMAMKMWEP